MRCGAVDEGDMTKKMHDSITPATTKDSSLFDSYLKEKVDFEDSFHYLKIYFCSPGQTLFKFHEGDALIFFSRNKRGHYKVFKPLGEQGEEKLPALLRYLSKQSQHPLDIRFLTNERISFLKERGISLTRVQSFDFLLYDLRPERGGVAAHLPCGFVPVGDGDETHPASILSLKGRRTRDLRQKINHFTRHHLGNVSTEELSFDNLKDGIHFFSKWKKKAQERGFSYIDTEKNKTALRYLADKVDGNNIWCTLYRIGGVVEGVQALYQINETTAAHIIGSVNIGLAGFSEWSQVDIWEKVAGGGVRYVNDGYSWTPRLRSYKMKFCPSFVKMVYRGLY